MNLCRLCGNAGKFVKAHVIPEAFFRRADGEVPLLVSANSFQKRAPIGVYDSGILCDQCEPKFDRMDSYGAQILRNRFDELFLPITNAGETVGFDAEGIDQKLLLQFLIATLWRASVSTQEFYGRVRLGPIEQLAKEVVLNPENQISRKFSAVLSRWTSDEKHRYAITGLMSPFPEKWQGINAYRFYFGEAVAFMKVDSRPWPSPLCDAALLAQSRLTLIARDIATSKDFAAMAHTVKKSHQHQEKFRRTYRVK